MLDSDASPVAVDHPKALAEIIVQWLTDFGFKIVADDREAADRCDEAATG